MDLKSVIRAAEKKNIAIGHFNVAETSVLKAIFESAKKIGVPVIIGTSEGEAGFLGRKQAATLVQSLREEFKFPIFINSDHTHSFEEVKKAVAAGYDAIGDQQGLCLAQHCYCLPYWARRGRGCSLRSPPQSIGVVEA